MVAVSNAENFGDLFQEAFRSVKALKGFCGSHMWQLGSGKVSAPAPVPAPATVPAEASVPAPASAPPPATVPATEPDTQVEAASSWEVTILFFGTIGLRKVSTI